MNADIEEMSRQAWAESREGIFGSSSTAAPPRDFEGFEGPHRPRSPGPKGKKERKRKKRRKRKDSSSSESSEDEAPPRRRAKRGKLPKKGQDPGESEKLLAQFTSLLKQMGLPQPEHPGEPAEQTGGPSGSNPKKPSKGRKRDRESGDTGEDSNSDDEEEMLLGTEIPGEAFEKASETLRRILGFDDPAPPELGSHRDSKLTLNAARAQPKLTMPVDPESYNRYELIAKARRWKAFPAIPSKTFKVEETDWKALLKVPDLPDQAKEKLVSGGAVHPQTGKYLDKASAKWEKTLKEVDLASRTGLRFSSSLLLMAEIVSRSFQQADAGGVSRKDCSAVIALLGPVSRLIYDQFARTSVRATRARRDMAVQMFQWPTLAIKEVFSSLPLMGEDLFGGKFDETLQLEAEKRKSMREAGLYLTGAGPSRSRPALFRFRAPFPRSRGQDRSGSQAGRSTWNQGSRGPSYNRGGIGRGARRGRGRGGSRGSFRPYRP